MHIVQERICYFEAQPIIYGRRFLRSICTEPLAVVGFLFEFSMPFLVIIPVCEKNVR